MSVFETHMSGEYGEPSLWILLATIGISGRCISAVVPMAGIVECGDGRRPAEYF